MWQSVICCLLAGLLMWIPDWFGVMNVWTLLIPAALFFFGAGMLFPLATSGAMEPFPFLAGTAGALVGGLQNIGSGVLASLSAMLPQTGQGSLGLLMTLMGLLIVLCWLPLATRMSHQGSLFKLTSPQHRHQLHGRTMLLYQITHHPHMRRGVRIKRLIARTKHVVWRLLPSVRAQAMPVARLAATTRLRVFAATPFL